MWISEFYLAKIRHHSSINLVWFLYLFFETFDLSLKHVNSSPDSSSIIQCAAKCSSRPASSSVSIKKLRWRNHLPNVCFGRLNGLSKWQAVLFLILMFYCFIGQLNAKPSRSSNLSPHSSDSTLNLSLKSSLNFNSSTDSSSNSSSDSSSELSFNLSSPFYSKKNESIFTQFSSYLMSFLSSNPNNTHNQVINQLSNQPSNSSELELFKQLNLLSRIDNVKRLFESVSDTVESVRNALTTALKNNKNTTNSKITNNIINRSRNESVKKHSINGHRHIPLHRLMHKDEIKLFLNDLYNEEINSRSTESHLAYHSRHQNDTSINQKITSGNSDVDPNSSPIKSADEDYELIAIDEIESDPTLPRSTESTGIKNSPRKLKLRFDLFNQTVELDLELNKELFAPNFTVQKSSSRLAESLELANLNCFYHGTLSKKAKESDFEDVRPSKAIDRNRVARKAKPVDSMRIKNIVSLSTCNGLRGFIQTSDYLYFINPLNEQLISRFNSYNQIKLNNDILFVKRTKNKDLINKLAKQISAQIKRGTNSESRMVPGDRKSAREWNVWKHQLNMELPEQKAKVELNEKEQYQHENEEHSSDEELVDGRTNVQTSGLKRSKRSNHKSRLDYQNPTIELAVFGDESLYNYLKNTYFIKTDHQIVTFILTVVNGIQSLFNQFHKYDINLKFNIVLLEIFQKQPKDLIATDLQEKYLFRFCSWQSKRKYENTRNKFGHWDHAFLLTALDLARYDKETKTKVDSVIGSALVGKMCTESSCSIGEGTLLGTILVMAHEIAHSMDLSHDGDMEHSGTNNCQNEKYVMTSSLGPGVYSFSPCSARELKDYLRKANAKCLFVNNSKLRLKKKFLNEFHITDEDDVLGSWDKAKLLPGQVYSIDDQCKLVFGESAFYAPTKYYTLCEAVTCRLNSTYEGIRYAHPTLEGTRCSYEKWCKKGECIRSSLREIDSKDILNNEIISSNPYSIDLSTWKSDKRPSNRTASRPSWKIFKIFENNYDTTVNKRLLNSRLKNQTTTLLVANGTSDTVNHTTSQIAEDTISSDSKRTIASKTNLTNLAAHWTFDKQQNVNFSNNLNDSQFNHGWSNWSVWSDCVTECVISDQDRQPIGFQVSTRRCNSNSCLGSRVRLKLCDAKHLCSAQSKYHLKTLDQYVGSVCDTQSISLNQSNEVKIEGCFIKNCPNNELVLSHELQLPNTSPCLKDDFTSRANSYCWNGDCRTFDCSGLSESTDTTACNEKTVGFVTVNEEEDSSVNEWHPLSYCQQSCLLNSRGVQLVYQDCGTNECSSYERQSFQLCSTAEQDCLERELRSVNDYANEICTKYKLRYPSLLSGRGKQLAPRKDNIHSSCIVSCADLKLPNVYYEMNSILDGQFPLGTNCTFNSSIKSYCVNGKCIQFANDLTPIDKTSVNTFSNLRKQFPREMMYRNRHG